MPRQSKRVVIGLTFVIIFIVLVSLAILSNRNLKLSQVNQPAEMQTQAATPGTSSVTIPDTLPTQAPPLANVPFSEKVIDYPTDWPSDLKYPNDFQLVGATSGHILSDSPTGYSTKLIFKGTPGEAADNLIDFFTAAGWKINQRSDLDTGGVLLMVQITSGHEGIIVIDKDPQNPSGSRIEATVNP